VHSPQLPTIGTAFRFWPHGALTPHTLKSVKDKGLTLSGDLAETRASGCTQVRQIRDETEPARHCVTRRGTMAPAQHGTKPWGALMCQAGRIKTVWVRLFAGISFSRI